MSFIEQIPTYLWYAFQLFFIGFFAFGIWGILYILMKNYEEQDKWGMKGTLGQFIFMMLLGLFVLGCLMLVGFDVSLDRWE